MLTALHVFFVFATLAVVLYADEQAFLWILGKHQRLSNPKLELLHALTGIGLACLVATGGLLFLERERYLLNDPIFYIKMAFVAALIINGFFISAMNHIAAKHPWRELSTRQRLPLLISGAISVVGWTGAAICGLLL